MIKRERWLELRDVDFTSLVKEKQGMSYISWGDMEYLVHSNLTDEELQTPVDYSVADGIVTVTIGTSKYPLAISDFRNNAIENPDATDICDTLQRATVKAYARHFGLAHKLYESSYYDEPSAKTTTRKPPAKAKAPANSSSFF
jgi:hypothetical protein